MIKIGDKVKCLVGYDELTRGAIYTVESVTKSWDGKTFLHFKEVPYGHHAKDFEKC